MAQIFMGHMSLSVTEQTASEPKEMFEILYTPDHISQRHHGILLQLK